MIYLIIYVVGYILSYLLGRHNMKTWRKNTYGDYPHVTYDNQDMLFNFGLSIGSWGTVFVQLCISIHDYYKWHHKPKILTNISDWYFIWKNEESKL